MGLSVAVSLESFIATLFFSQPVAPRAWDEFGKRMKCNGFDSLRWRPQWQWLLLVPGRCRRSLTPEAARQGEKHFECNGNSHWRAALGRPSGSWPGSARQARPGEALDDEVEGGCSEAATAASLPARAPISAAVTVTAAPMAGLSKFPSERRPARRATDSKLAESATDCRDCARAAGGSVSGWVRPGNCCLLIAGAGYFRPFLLEPARLSEAAAEHSMRMSVDPQTPGRELPGCHGDETELAGPAQALTQRCQCQ